MDKSKFKLGEPAVSNTKVVGWLSKRYDNTVCIQSGKTEHSFKWCDVQLLDDLDCEWDGEKLIINYESEVMERQEQNGDSGQLQQVSKKSKEKDVIMEEKNRMSSNELKEYLANHPGEYTMNDVKELSGLAMQSCRIVLKHLEALGKVHKEGQTRGTKWVVTG